MLSVYVRDGSTLAKVAQLDHFERLQTVERWLGVGRWIIVAPLTAPGMDSFLDLGADAGLIVQDETTGRIVFSGPVGVDGNDRPTIRREVLSEGGELVSRLIVMGDCDNAWLRDRVAHPQPLTGSPPWSSTAHDVLTGPATSVILDLIDRNAGPTAVAARQVSGLTIGSDPEQGSTITARARWQNLLAYLAELATAGGIGFEVRQVARTLTARAFLQADVSANIAFSLDWGNLAGFAYDVGQADGTAIYCGGQGEGTARTIAVTSGAGRRVEKFVDRRDLSDSTELATAAAVALTEGSGRTSLTIETLDTDQAVYGRDYRLGDLVSVVVDGVRITDAVTTATTTIEGGTTTRAITVGPEDNRGPAALYAGIATLSRRVRQLERI